MRKLMIEAVTRIEGHAKISIQLDDNDKVESTQLHITQVRGFEKFTEGRPYYEMPSITARICGICPISHLLASSKACDAILSVAIPETAVLLREIRALRPVCAVARSKLFPPLRARPSAGYGFQSGGP